MKVNIFDALGAAILSSVCTGFSEGATILGFIHTGSQPLSVSVVNHGSFMVPAQQTSPRINRYARFGLVSAKHETTSTVGRTLNRQIEVDYCTGITIIFGNLDTLLNSAPDRMFLHDFFTANYSSGGDIVGILSGESEIVNLAGSDPCAFQGFGIQAEQIKFSSSGETGYMKDDYANWGE